MLYTEVVNKRVEKIIEVKVFHDFLKFINQIRIRNTLLQKFLHIDLIFFDQLIVCSVKFGKRFAEFRIPIGLF